MVWKSCPKNCSSRAHSQWTGGITQKTETFILNSVNQGKERITKFKTTLILSIIANIENHFESPKDDSVYPTFQLFNISIRTDATDTDLIIELDAKKTGDLAVCFTNPLDKHKFDLCQAMKEWI